jgi:membrane fusion protein, adhesin transport system
MRSAPPSSPDTLAALPNWSERVQTKASSRLLLTLGAAMLVFTGWAATFELDKVTRGTGRVLPSIQNQVVQHLEGGIISEILVKEGERVRKGQVLMRLSNQFTSAEASNAQTDVVAKQIAVARMEAEARGDSSLRLPDALVRQRPDIAASEQALFQSRRMQVSQEVSIAEEQVRSAQLKLQSLSGREENLRSEEKLLTQQLTALERALAADAISEHEVLDKRSQLQQLRTRIADVAAEMPRTRAEMAEAQGRKREVWLRFVSENKAKIAQFRLEQSKAGEALGAFKDRLSREELRAPMDGVVNKILVQTVGGVVRGGEPLVEIVPVDHSVMIEAEVAPQDRGKIWEGLPATVKISAYDFAQYGGLEGKVIDISADALQRQDGKTFYRVRLRADTARWGKEKPVIPGMTAEVDITSGKQTVLQYILAPVSAIQQKALRE